MPILAREKTGHLGAVDEQCGLRGIKVVVVTINHRPILGPEGDLDSESRAPAIDLGQRGSNLPGNAFGL